jgi:exopolyphosphatase / guanosine-5'-triphosphate,3'-diphosphate pyrophosphatase
MRAAVVDVGSNSIKLLVADARPDGRLVEVRSRTLDARISAGISSKAPSLGADGIERGVAAVAILVAEAKGLGADNVAAVATSAVRDASNGAEFQEKVKAATGVGLRILTGVEEASLIGRGLTTDPALQGLGDFRVFDLGGGSLECLSFRDRVMERALSLPLGCVRLTEMFVAEPSTPFTDASARRIGEWVKAVLVESNFPFPVPATAAVVGTGGTLTTVRAMAAAKQGSSLEETEPRISVALLAETLGATGPRDLAQRKRIPGLPPARADVFPAALATLLALAELGQFSVFQHSLRNLRWGVAAEMLGASGS